MKNKDFGVVEVRRTKRYVVGEKSGHTYIKFIGFKGGSYPFVSTQSLESVIDHRPKYQKEILGIVKRWTERKVCQQF